MKKIYYFILTAVLLCGPSACTEILETAPNNQISSGTMWTSEELVNQGVIGVYYSLQRPLQGGGIVGESVSIGYYGFDVLGMSGQGSYGIDNLFTESVNPGNTRFSFTWKWCYDGIHRANDAIAHIPGAPMSDEKKGRLVAECKVLRAFFYSRLNELFGGNGLGVPLYLEPVSPSECDRAQTPEADVWAQVIADLTEAIDEPALPDNQIQGEGRVSRGAAYALRGRTYLITKDYQKAVADFAKVGDCGYKLFAPTGTSNDYKQLFKLANERCEEMILSVQYIEDPAGYGSRLQKYCAPFQAGSKDGRGCWTDLQIAPAVVDLYEVKVNNSTVKPFNWADYFPQWNSLSVDDRKVFFIRDRLYNGNPILANVTSGVNTQLNTLSSQAVKDLYLTEGNEIRIRAAYENRDPRLGYNVITPYSTFRGVNSNSTAEGDYVLRWPAPAKVYFDNAAAEGVAAGTEGMLPTGSANANAKFMYIHRKFVGEGLEYQRRQDNPVDEIIIRYADVLLMWAEALVELDDLSGAKAKVKAVRDRAGMPTMDAYFADKNVARNYVRDERRREFVNEGVNFFDEMRWRTLHTTKFGQRYPQVVWGAISSGGTQYQWIGDHWYTWPVPKAEVELNPNLQRTPGWTY
ncbi:MAG: RagB/SusD family nutrient uptake outer membrane protein [Prevotellaceae bacterium]|jgi:hypothetical protein|nr:RagB/SusD family nutrient uptake outer membrane protein [Prevotellaceae bacterium]